MSAYSHAIRATKPVYYSEDDPTFRAPNLPYLGATIHLEGFDKCRVAICTGLSDSHGPMAFVTIFAPNLPMQNGVLNGDGWHYTMECTNLYSSANIRTRLIH